MATYNAFISYSHAVDGQLAPALRFGLQRFAKPWYLLRAVHIFCDQTNLSVHPGLWSMIENALSESEHFILLASPDAAQSKWVHQEVDYWLRARSPDRLFLVLTDGVIAWDSATGDFDWGRTTALPPHLREVYREEPFFLDLRWAHSATDLSLRNPEFLKAVAQLSATLRGKPLDELVGEDVRQNRATRRLVRIVATVLITVTMAAIAASIVAVQERNNAEQQRNNAEQQRRLAEQRSQEAQRRLAEGLVFRGDTFSLASRWREAHADYTEARTLLAQLGRSVFLADLGTWALHRQAPPPLLELRGHTKHLLDVAFSPDGRTLLSASADATLKLWDTVDGREPRTFQGHSQEVLSVAVSPNGQLAVSGGMDKTVRVWDMSSGHELRTLRGHEHWVSSVAFSPDGRLAVSGSFDKTIRVWDVARWGGGA